MAVDPTYTVAGTSILKGVNTYRFSNGTVKARTDKLLRHDHSEVKLYELPHAMTKTVAIQWLIDNSAEIAANAIIPSNGRSKGEAKEKLSPEQKAELRAAAKAERARLRELKKAAVDNTPAVTSPEDAAFINNITGDQTDSVEAVSDVVAETVVELAPTAAEGADELLALLDDAVVAEVVVASETNIASDVPETEAA